MKNYLSITNEFLKKRIYKMFIVLAAMALCDVLAAFVTLKRVEKFMLSYVFSDVSFLVILGIGFIACLFICSNTGSQDYSKKQNLIGMGIANAITFIVFWLVHAVFITGLACYLFESPDCTEKAIGLYIDFERTPFMHVMLPIADLSMIIRNITFAVCIGLNLAMLRHQLENKRMPYLFIYTCLMIVLEFVMRYGNTVRNYIFAGVSILLTVICVIYINLNLDKEQRKEGKT